MNQAANWIAVIARSQAIKGLLCTFLEEVFLKVYHRLVCEIKFLPLLFKVSFLNFTKKNCTSDWLER